MTTNNAWISTPNDHWLATPKDEKYSYWVVWEMYDAGGAMLKKGCSSITTTAPLGFSDYKTLCAAVQSANELAELPLIVNVIRVEN